MDFLIKLALFQVTQPFCTNVSVISPDLQICIVTPFFLPEEDPYQVLLRPKLHPAMGARPLTRQARQRQQEGTGHGRPERAPGRHSHDATPQTQSDCVEAVS